MINATFYPTPPSLAKKMIDKIDLKGKNAYDLAVLEPSAGAGDLIAALNNDRYDGFRGNGTFRNIFAIEKDPDLRAMLRGQHINVIDSDFLAYSGPDKFDLIIANPPFNEGDKHLLKAIDILYRGQIIFLLNAETVRNPHTNTRKDLKRKLNEMDAEIEFIKDGFMDAERKTEVEVALISIKVDRKIEEDLFAGVEDAAPGDKEEIKEKYEVSNGKKVQELVAEYNQVVRTGTDVIVGYYKGYRKVGKYIGLNEEADKYHFDKSDLTTEMQSKLNNLLAAIRKDFWRRCFELPEVHKRMTREREEEFEETLRARTCMDFTENNIRQLVLNIINGYESSLMGAVLKLFDKFSRKHSYYSDNKEEKNIHYFNGWKTNDAFKVGKKVIIPVSGGYRNSPFVNDYSGKWDMCSSASSELYDIDIVMNYFDGMNKYQSIPKAINVAFTMGQSRKILSTYFEITVYKKGTIHLVFNDEGILRRFNLAACKGKGWLPCDYGAKPYGKLSIEERNVAESFEGKKSYNEHIGQPMFDHKEPGLLLDVQKGGDLFN